MLIRILLFAAAREFTGANSLRLDLAVGATVADLRAELSHDFPAMAPLLAKSAVAVNQDFAEDSRVLSPQDEVAIIPPVSGG
jgi:MoaE-MoaD fusion protein